MSKKPDLHNLSDLDKIRHSVAHLMAAAVLKLWPDTKMTLGPPIENGFYYDFAFSQPISDDDLPKIEKTMKKILPTWKSFDGKKISAEEAQELFKGNEFKLEMINQLDQENETITVYTSGDFTDLCRGGHVEQPNKEMKHFKLLSVAGAYWRGDEANPMLTRIYGTAFATKEELEEHLYLLEEAKKRDHRKLGKDLDLYTFSEDVGPGLTLWKPKGTVIRDELENWGKETERAWGYERVATPHIAKHTLFETSGHLPYYKDDMYSAMDIDGEDYYLKGMNCPLHHEIFLSSAHSYRDLPLRYAEYGMVYRYEQSGTLFGLMRVRSIEQNDAHIYCTMDQAEEEFLQVLKLHEYYYQKLGLTPDDYYILIGLPDESKRDKYHGDKELWDKAEAMMRSAIEKSGIKAVDDIGGAAFYGPKIDIVIKSAIGREFTISTNQLDLFMPRRFNLQYTNDKGEKEYCAVIHRAPLGSHERFVGFLIEHFAGEFPLWLSPVHVSLLSVGADHHDFVKELASELKKSGLRVEVDNSDETVGKKIRHAATQKIPYVLVIGDKEMNSDKLHVRVRGQEELLEVDKDTFVKGIQKKIQDKELSL
ncbi:MAG: threonine--tRNA ligase [Patescibacteria group bacterium]